MNVHSFGASRRQAVLTMRYKRQLMTLKQLLALRPQMFRVTFLR